MTPRHSERPQCLPTVSTASCPWKSCIFSNTALRNSHPANTKCCLVGIMFYFQHINTTCGTVAPFTHGHISSSTHTLHAQNSVGTNSGYQIIQYNPCIRTLVAATDALDMWFFSLHPDTSCPQPLAASSSTRIASCTKQAETPKPVSTLRCLVDTLNFSANSGTAPTSGAMNNNQVNRRSRTQAFICACR
jgi:hypothetical protein